MTFTLPAPLARRHRDLLETFGAAEQAYHELQEPIAEEEIARQALEFLLVLAEHLIAHHQEDAARSWEPYLVDFVQQFTYADEEGGVHNALNAIDLDSVVLDCCALDDESDVQPPRERLATLRSELHELRARQDEFTLG